MTRQVMTKTASCRYPLERVDAAPFFFEVFGTSADVVWVVSVVFVVSWVDVDTDDEDSDDDDDDAVVELMVSEVDVLIVELVISEVDVVGADEEDVDSDELLVMTVLTGVVQLWAAPKSMSTEAAKACLPDTLLEVGAMVGFQAYKTCCAVPGVITLSWASLVSRRRSNSAYNLPPNTLTCMLVKLWIVSKVGGITIQ